MEEANVHLLLSNAIHPDFQKTVYGLPLTVSFGYDIDGSNFIRKFRSAMKLRGEDIPVFIIAIHSIG